MLTIERNLHFSGKYIVRENIIINTWGLGLRNNFGGYWFIN